MGQSKVAIARGGDDKFKLLDEVADRAGFWPHVETAWEASQKSREHFSIAVKPNLMIFMNRQVPETATDPELVEHLLHRLNDRGFTNLKVVESQNTMGNWVKNRSVANVARVAGYTGKGYQIVDLSLEMDRYTYKVKGMPNWTNFVGRSWRDADYRIDFAKFKSQPDNRYTLNLKNQFGTLPLQNKYMEYHTRLPYWACTMYTLDNFPVQFGFIDAWIGSDGAGGFAVQYNPKLFKIMLAGQDILALDLVGARLMGVDAWESPLPRFVMMNWGEPEIEVDGDDTPLADWNPVPEEIHNIVDIGQAIYIIANVGAAAGILNLDTKEFPPRISILRWYYLFLNWIFLTFYGRRVSRRNRESFHRELETQRTSQLAAKSGHRFLTNTASGAPSAKTTGNTRANI
jgi:uncharacterized protein (DUF362 family)